MSSTSWYKYDLTNERQFINCIKKLEFMCRKSFSYDSWQKRSKYAVSSCPVCGDSFEFVRPESHHHPRTLFSIVEGILQNHIDKNDINDFTDFQICDEIMQAHFEKKVDYIVLCKHCHEKYHADVPDILDVIDEAQMAQRKIINSFYTKEIHATKKED
jgi:transcription elongation factor Elf1